MSSELSILALFGLLLIATVVAQAAAAIGQVGLRASVGPRDDVAPLTGVAGRFRRTVDNSVVAMALFAPVILILSAKEAFTAETLLLAQVFLVARLIYVPLYVAGVPWLRTLVWIAGLMATIRLYMHAV